MVSIKQLNGIYQIKIPQKRNLIIFLSKLKKKNLIHLQKAYLEWKKSIKKNHVKINKIRFKSFIKRDNCDFTLSTIDTDLVYKNKKLLILDFF